MTDQSTDGGTVASGTRGRRRVLRLAVATAVLAAGGGAGAFVAGRTGLVAGLLESQDGAWGDIGQPATEPPPRFLELDPALVAVGGPGSVRQLRFRAFLEVSREGAAHAEQLAPRLLDICASYLRALDLDTLEDPAALFRIRSQLLRRVQLMAGQDAVKDLLIVDFVIT